MKKPATLLPLMFLVACGTGGPHEAGSPNAATAKQVAKVAPADPVTFLKSTLRPGPAADGKGQLAITDPARNRVAVYDSALVILVLIRHGRREEAARIIDGLSALQSTEGSLPFSFTLHEHEAAKNYVRSGALAWVGYAACEYLDAERGGSAREAALAMAHRAAGYLLAHQVNQPGDLRDGLVRAGSGMFRYELDRRGDVHEEFEPGELAWTSVEHNIDTYFFFRALSRVSGERRYAEAADRIARGLQRAWSNTRGQNYRGLGATEPDEVLALDCASWGSLFFSAVGDKARAETSLSVADGRFASYDPKTSARGHLAFSEGPLLESVVLMKRYADVLPAKTWDRLSAVWPEGSAGVALAAWRAGRGDRARAILDNLEPLRGADGSLPTFTAELPYEFDTKPSIAGTAWVDLVRFELGRPPNKPTLWAP